MRPRQALPALFLGAVAIGVSGCDDLKSPAHKTNVAAAVPATSSTPAMPVTPAPDTTSVAPNPTTPDAPTVPTTPAATSAMAQSIEAAQVSNDKPVAAKPSPLLIRVEVLLDRAHFSPGVIDGRPGGNLNNALAAYRRVHGMNDGGPLDAQTLSAMTAEDKGAVTQSYAIAPEDEAGPFIGALPVGIEAQSKLPALGYTDPVQALAAKFHMSEGLLKALNPDVDFTKSGTSIVVVQAGMAPLPSSVAKLEVDKAANQVRALDGGGKVLAAFPATVGSTERPAPSGEWAVKAVAPNPDYTYDPKKLTFGPSSKGVMTVKPGPNNPVGSTWIALTKETYGIHGTPDPAKVGKTASHGCVRLTNWDAAALGKAVKKGTPVVFVGETTKG